MQKVMRPTQPPDLYTPLINRHNLTTERRDRHNHQFEMLQAERDSDDRNAKHQPQCKVGQRNPDAADQEPDKIHQERKTTPILLHDHRPMAERQERQRPQFEDLESERDPNDGQTHKDAGQEVFDSDHETAENNPNNISEYIHRTDIGFTLIPR